MDTTELVLLTVSCEKELLKGRTLLQKVAYFVNELEDCGISFFAHYYGPYSREIANAVDGTVATGLLKEIQTDFNVPKSDYLEFRRYDYHLTRAGQRYVKLIVKDNPKKSRQICSTLKKIHKVLGHDYQTLSIAAKTHHILKYEPRPMDSGEISKVARSIGWRLSEHQVENLCEFLAKLKLITEARPSRTPHR